MKKKHLFLLPLFAVLLIGVFVFGFSLNTNFDSLGESIGYNSMVCISTTGDFDGRETSLGEYESVGCHSNVLYNTGKEGIEALIGAGGASDAFDWIELGDAALAVGVPSAGKAEAYTAHAADGLSEVAGTQGTNAASGNWTVYYEFTSTAVNQLTNISRLRNAAGTDLAGNTFALVNLSNGDKLNVTWDVWVT